MHLVDIGSNDKGFPIDEAFKREYGVVGDNDWNYSQLHRLIDVSKPRFET